jgi:predicted nucleotidyltransferase
LISFENLESGLVFAEIKRKLENKLKRKIDLITFNSLDYSDLKDEILAEAKTIYEKRQ